jgi:hypothetical protein
VVRTAGASLEDDVARFKKETDEIRSALTAKELEVEDAELKRARKWLTTKPLKLDI